MATVTKTCGQAGSGADFIEDTGAGNYAIIDAINWFEANHNFGSDGIAQVKIIDSGTYEINAVTDVNIPGTPSLTAYFELTSTASNPSVGPTINCTQTTSNAALKLWDQYSYINNVQFELNTTTTSAECVRAAISGLSNILISRCIFTALNQTTQQDAVYAGAINMSASIDHCVFVGFGRACIQAQLFSGSSLTHTWNIDHCSAGASSRSTENQGGFVSCHLGSTNGTTNVNAYNNLAYAHISFSNSDLFNTFSTGSTVNWAGSHNVVEDASAEAKFTSSHDSVTFTESAPSSGENAWLTEINNADETLINLDIAGENAYTVLDGTDRTGSEPDSRQDFSTDILGRTRGATPDIGAFEYTAGGTPVTEVLTGIGGTGSAGSLSVTAQQQIVEVLAGVEGAGAVGELVILAARGVTVALEGVAGTGSIGALAVSLPAVVTLDGAGGTGSAGDPTAALPATVTLEGGSGVGSAGGPAVSLSTTAVLAGAQGEGQAGDLIASIPISVTLTGAEGAGSAGDPLVVTGVTIVLEGASGTGAAGDLSISTVRNVTLILPGVSATGAAGTLTITTTSAALWWEEGSVITIWAEASPATTTWVEASPAATVWSED